MQEMRHLLILLLEYHVFCYKVNTSLPRINIIYDTERANKKLDRMESVKLFILSGYQCFLCRFIFKFILSL